MTSPGKRFSTLPKDCFPSKLKAMVEELNLENLVAGFKACGLVPLNRHEVLKRLPKTSIAINDSNNAVNNVTLSIYKNFRGSEDTAGPSRWRRRKLNVVAGRSVGKTETQINADLQLRKWIQHFIYQIVGAKYQFVVNFMNIKVIECISIYLNSLQNNSKLSEQYYLASKLLWKLASIICLCKNIIN